MLAIFVVASVASGLPGSAAPAALLEEHHQEESDHTGRHEDSEYFGQRFYAIRTQVGIPPKHQPRRCTRDHCGQVVSDRQNQARMLRNFCPNLWGTREQLVFSSHVLGPSIL
jgi:hypothetical protein